MVSTPQPLERFTFTQYHMGVDARIIAYAPDESSAEKACAAAFKRIAELDTIMSDYRKDSELNRLCARAGGPPIQVSPDLLAVFIRAQEISRLTGGAFDITAAPVIQLWRTARRTTQLPTKAEIDAARRLVGYRNLTFDKPSRFVRLRLPGMKLDLGGIAKGYACDEAQKVLRAHGVKSALVEMGGDIVVSDAPPGAPGWKIMVTEARGGEIRTFKNCAVSTSGDTEQFVIIGGKRYSHVVDPRNGWAITNRVQATVVAKDGLTSDPVSKIFALTDTQTARRVLRHYGVAESYVRVAAD